MIDLCTCLIDAVILREGCISHCWSDQLNWSDPAPNIAWDTEMDMCTLCASVDHQSEATASKHSAPALQVPAPCCVSDQATSVPCSISSVHEMCAVLQVV